MIYNYTVPIYKEVSHMKIFARTFAILLTSLIAFSLTSFSKPFNESESFKERISNALMLYIGSPRVSVNGQNTYIDTENKKVVPYIKNERTMVPVRLISESFGAQVEWDESTKAITLTKGKTKIILAIGDEYIYISGVLRKLDAPPEIKNDRSFLPLRILANAFGKKAFYDRGLVVISDTKNIFDPQTEKGLINQAISMVNNIEKIGTYDKLIEISELYSAIGIDKAKMLQDLGLFHYRGPFQPESPFTATVEYSKTNSQMSDIDDEDIVKTDGKYIYQINNDNIVITRVCPYEYAKAINVIDYGNEDFKPKGLHINNNKLIVIGKTKSPIPSFYLNTSNDEDYSTLNTTKKATVKVIIYDITITDNIKVLREFEIEGDYVSSRIKNSQLYMVSEYRFDYFNTINNFCNPTPSYKDSNEGDKFIPFSFDEVYHVPGDFVFKYITMTALNLGESSSRLNNMVFLAGSINVYMSENNVYIIRAFYNVTKIYKFSIHDSSFTYINSYIVPGLIRNNFSMDEYNGMFRIATRNADEGKILKGSNIFIFNEILSLIGTKEGIAPDVTMKSVRFIGSKAYLHTSLHTRQKNDSVFSYAFFAIDLSDPTNPQMLCELNFTDYINYFIPYDENHIIGFEIETEKLDNDILNKKVYKIALFDFSDVNNPINKFNDEITLNSGYLNNTIFYDIEAILFSKEKNLFAIPISYYDDEIRGRIQYLYVCDIDVQNGLNLKKTVSTIRESDLLLSKSNSQYSSRDKLIKKSILIGDYIYTISDKIIKVYDINTMNELKTIELDNFKNI